MNGPEKIMGLKFWEGLGSFTNEPRHSQCARIALVFRLWSLKRLRNSNYLLHILTKSRVVSINLIGRLAY